MCASLGRSSRCRSQPRGHGCHRSRHRSRPPGSSTTSWATRRFRRMPTTACRPPARSRTSRSPEIAINHYPGFVEAWAIVKLAAARANTDVGAMKPETLAAIEKAAQAVLDGKYHDQFLVDWYQGGAGTS